MDSRVPSPPTQQNLLSAAVRLFSMTSDAVLEVNADDEIVSNNPQAELLFGLRTDDMTGRVTSKLPPQITQCLADARAAQRRTSSAFWDNECIIGSTDGSNRVLALRIFHDMADLASGLPTLLVVRDITQSRQGPQRVMASESRLHALADIAPALIWGCGIDSSGDYFNRRWLEFTGRSVDEECGDGWFDGMHPADRELYASTYSKAFANQQSFQSEYRLRRHDGVFRWLMDIGNPCFADDGSFTGYVGCCTDITEHRELEDRLRLQTQELTLAADRKDEFLAMLSHELRNPLTPISSSVAVMRRFDNLDPLLAQSHGVVDRQVENLRILVNDLLDVARINSGKINLSKGMVSLNEIIDRALEISRPKIDQAAHSLSVSMAPETAFINGDPMRLAQALSNILNNAAKFTPPHGKISVIAAVEDERGLLTVKDNGAGISEEFRPRLFELFAQADESLARTQSGLGIGLAIAHQIISLHDGLIEVNSDGIGHGSEFTLALPLIDQGAIPMHEQTTAVADATGAVHDFRVLLIDDNEDANESMAALLELLGYQVRTATDGVAALQVAQEFEPQLILSDIGLPGMDGYQLAPALRKVAGERKVIIAAATGYGHASDRLRSQAAGFDHHLVKPLDADTLLNFVAQQAASY